jgi:hypothetical protein
MTGMFKGKCGQEIQKGNEYIHPDGMQITGSPAGKVFLRKEPRLKCQILYGDKKLGIVMCNVFKEMSEKVSERLFYNDILLSAVTTIPVFYSCSTVKTVLFMSQVL